MVSHPETGSDSPIGSDRDRGRDSIVVRTCLHFNTNLYTYLALVKFLASLPRRIFCVDINNNALRYYF